MTAQAKKIGAKKVRTKHGSLIIFNDNWEVVGVDDNPDAMRMGGSLPNAQKGPLAKMLNEKGAKKINLGEKHRFQYGQPNIANFETLLSVSHII